MQNSPNMDDVIRKIKALIAKSIANPSEAEAMLCAAKAEEMMRKYNLSRSQVDENVISENLHRKRANENWQKWIAKSAAMLFNCAIVHTEFGRVKRGSGEFKMEKTWIFIGREGDRITTEIMYDYFQKTVKTLARRYANETGCPNRERNMFARSCAIRLSERIYEMAKRTSDKRQLALVDEYIDNVIKAVAGRKSKGIVLRGDAAKKGFEAAENICINLQTKHDGKGNLAISEIRRIK